MEKGPKIAIGIIIGVVVIFGLLTLAAAAKKRAAEGGGAAAPEGMTAQDLTNTSWEVKVMGHTASIDLHAGGQAVANLPPQVLAMAKQMLNMDIPPQVPGTWSVTENVLTMGVEFMGKKQQVTCEIRGQKVFYKEGEKEQEARRLR